MADSGVTAPVREKRLAHPILEHDATSEWLGISVQDLADGYAVITMDLRPEMLNGFSIAHGGLVFAFADTAFALLSPCRGQAAGRGQPPCSGRPQRRL